MKEMVGFVQMVRKQIYGKTMQKLGQIGEIWRMSWGIYER